MMHYLFIIYTRIKPYRIYQHFIDENFEKMIRND